MLVFGMAVDQAGRPTERRYRQHVHALWTEFRSFVTDRNRSEYLDLLPPGEPFAHWSVHDRYSHRRHWAAAAVRPHRDAATNLRAMVERAAQEGYR